MRNPMRCGVVAVAMAAVMAGSTWEAKQPSGGGVASAAVAAVDQAPRAGDGGAPPTGASADWWGQAQKNLKEAEYQVTWQEAPVAEGVEPSWHAPNRAQGFRTYFTPEGIRVVPRTETTPSWRWGLSLAGYGRGGVTWSVPEATLAPSGHRVDYQRGALLEHYENTARGLEQGFALPAPPRETGPGRAQEKRTAWTTVLKRRTEEGSGREINPQDLVHLDLELWGDLSPRIAEDGQAIDFVTPGGAPAVRYAQLKVTDARGEVLRSWMEGFAAEGLRGIRLVADARGAVYPLTVDPLATGAAWTAEGDQAGAGFGVSVATGGDVNGDGYSDVIVGARLYDNGEVDEGRAYVYLGSAAGLATSPAWSAEGDQVSAFFGSSVATGGDVNGDGYSDVIVGASSYDNGEANEGRAYVYLGSAGGLATSPAWSAESDQANAAFGGSVATAGDVNGDGYSDVIVGANSYDNGETNEGRAYIYLGSAGGLVTSPAWSAEGDQVWAQFGSSVATAGDVNGDGYSDVIVGAPYYDNVETGEGRAYVYLGSAAGLTTSPAWTAESDQVSAFFGRSVATAGDVNGDGYSDVIVGADGYDNGETDEGRAYVYLGSAAGLASSPSWTAESDQVGGAGFGYSVATAGDVNGDGYSDVIVGARNYDNGETDEGRAYVYLGSAAGPATTPGWTAESDHANALFGRSVATAGDVNGDGYSDVIVGASSYDNGQANEGRAYVYLGSAAGLATSPAWTAEGDQASAQFGDPVATAGDVNGDGYSDVIVGALNYDNGETDEGRAYVYLGSAAGLASAPAWIGEADQVAAGFGRSVATAGDVNGDGYSDVIVAAPGYTNGETSEGRAYVYLGSSAGLGTSPYWTAEGDQVSAAFGLSVATAGDVNGDGYSDVIVGASGYDNDQTNEGRAYVYLGSASGLAATPSWTAESDQAYANFGASAATAGDVNGDGYSDVIVGASGYDNDQTNEGRAHVYLGSATGVAATPAWTAESDQVGSQFGSPVATAGDVNGDGYSDVIVGAWFFDNGETDEGRAYVYLGSAAGLATAPSWIAESDQAGARFGVSAATAGDVNGDGYSDVIIGANAYDNGETNEGRALCYHGNDGDGLDRAPRQARADGTAPIDLLGRSDAQTSFRLRALGRSSLGRGRVHLEIEVKPLGTAFDASAIQAGAALDSGAPVPGAGSAAALEETVTGLTPQTPYHWRLRVATDSPFFPRSPWLTLPYNNRTETDLRTSGCLDADGDGYGAPGGPACPAGTETDCNDASAASHPGATEICDGFDNDCNAVVDDVTLPDADGDGRGDCADNCPAVYNPGQQNADGDAAGDACDACPLDAADDADGDGRCADVDNCPLVVNPDQSDRDADGQGDICDADDGEVHLRFTSPTALGWDTDTGQVMFNIYRGLLSGLHDTDGDGAADSYGACAAKDVAAAPWSDPAIPPAGDGFIYIVTGMTGSSESGPGVASSGAPRPMPQACGSSWAHAPVYGATEVTATSASIACDFTAAWNYALLYDYGFDARVTPGPLLLGGEYTEIRAVAAVTDGDSTPGQSDIQEVTASYTMSPGGMSGSLAQSDNGPVATEQFVQQSNVREACTGSPMPSQCSTATWSVGPDDAAAGDGTWTRRTAFVNLATAGPAAPFLADCIARDRGLEPRPAAAGTMLTFSLEARDRAGTAVAWGTHPVPVVGASTFSCTGDPCLCCFLVNGVVDGPCADLEGLVGPAAPNGACRP